jgi:O-acetyl-ADP-ribose deacetylase (regulator of RNase III)
MRERIEIKQGDITQEAVDAIVNAANNTLMGGGGVDGAIHKAAGPALAAECEFLGGCETGDAKITGGHHLQAKWVIHAVGPVWSGGNYREPELLASCYRKSLELAVEHEVKTIAFPSISTGAYAYPLNAAVRIALREVRDFLEQDTTIEKVTFVCFDRRTFDAYNAAIGELIPS